MLAAAVVGAAWRSSGSRSSSKSRASDGRCVAGKVDGSSGRHASPAWPAAWPDRGHRWRARCARSAGRPGRAAASCREHRGRSVQRARRAAATAGTTRSPFLPRTTRCRPPTSRTGSCPSSPTAWSNSSTTGIRVLLIDTWYGQETQRPGVVATSEQLQQTAALEQLEEDYGAALVDSALAVARRSVPDSDRTGARVPVPRLLRARAPAPSSRELERSRSMDGRQPARGRDAVHPGRGLVRPTPPPRSTQAGLLPYVHTQEDGQPWPTLGEMISLRSPAGRADGEPGRRNGVPVAAPGFRLGPGHAVRHDQAVAVQLRAQPWLPGQPDLPRQPLAQQPTAPGQRRERRSTRMTCCGRVCTQCEEERGRCPTTSPSTSTIKGTCCRSSTGSTASTEPPARRDRLGVARTSCHPTPRTTHFPRPADPRPDAGAATFPGSVWRVVAGGEIVEHRRTGSARPAAMTRSPDRRASRRARSASRSPCWRCSAGRAGSPGP